MEQWEQLFALWPAFLLVMVRLSSYFMIVPLFSYRTIPGQHKVLFSFALSVLVVTAIDVPILPVDAAYFMLVLKECFVGMALAFVFFFVVTTVQVAGGLIDFQVGFSMASVMDPMSGMQTPVTGRLFYTLFLFVLLVTDGHHLLIDAVLYSYKVSPIDGMPALFTEEAFLDLFVRLFGAMFLLAISMALPLIITLLLVDVALGILTRAVPQLNIFVVGLPLKVMVNLAILVMFAPVLIDLFGRLMQTYGMYMKQLFALLGGS
ncbi:MAG: flagellar biosynthetic protein FliR [Bacilli bacterium]